MTERDDGTGRQPDRRQVLGGGAAGTLAYLMSLSAVRGQGAGSQPFIGEIVPVAFSFAPHGYALCNGQLLPISQNQALFALVGTTFGGDGRVNFALPDLRGRTPVGAGNLGARGGEEVHTLTIGELPAHSHGVNVGTTIPTGRQRLSPVGAILGASPNPTTTVYGQSGSPVALAPGNIGSAGGSQAHYNIQPSLCINYIIALSGIFPTQD